MIFNIEEIARFFEVGERTVLSWIHRGWLKANKSPSCGRSRFKWIIDLPRLVEFIQNYYGAFESRKIKDKFIKSIVDSTPAGRAISVEEAAKVLGISSQRVRQRIATGQISAYRGYSEAGNFQWYVLKRFKCLNCGGLVDSIPSAPSRCPLCQQTTAYIVAI